MISHTRSPAASPSDSHAPGVRRTTKRGPASTSATDVVPSRLSETRRPSRMFRALSPCGSWFARRMSPARMAIRTRARTERSSERHFEIRVGRLEPAQHRARLRSASAHLRVEEILESRELGERFVRRRFHHVVRRAIGEHPAVFEDDDPFTEREYFTVSMCHIQNRDAVRRVPRFQVFDDAGLGGVIQRRQRLVEQQQRRIGDQRPRERGPLTLAARDGARLPVQHVRNPERFGDGARPRASDGARACASPYRGSVQRTGEGRAPDVERRTRHCAARDARDEPQPSQRAPDRRSRSVQRPGARDPPDSGAGSSFRLPMRRNTIVMPGGAENDTSSEKRADNRF